MEGSIKLPMRFVLLAFNKIVTSPVAVDIKNTNNPRKPEKTITSIDRKMRTIREIF